MKKTKSKYPKPKHKKKRYKQTGDSFIPLDMRLHALPPGWRKSSSGNWYFEARKNRSDKKGRRV